MADELDGRTKEARALKAAAAAAVVEPLPEPDQGEDVTYRFRDGDPQTVKWRGHEFKPNIPTRVTSKELLTAVRANPFFFRVGSDGSEVAQGGMPKTSMEYRGYVVGWLKDTQTVDQLAAHWSADRSLRDACEVSEDDVIWLGTLVEPKLRQMRMAEGLNEMAVAGVFIKHGVLQLPWRT